MYTIHISEHIKISFYNFCSNQSSLLVCHSANCVICKTESKRDLNISISSILNVFFFPCRLRFTVPSVQVHLSIIGSLQSGSFKCVGQVWLWSWKVMGDNAAAVCVCVETAVLQPRQSPQPLALINTHTKKGGFYSAGCKALRHLCIASCGPVCKSLHLFNQALKKSP